ncbi:hypothetical protein CR513_12458, partial [Mucuna pruriens]
MSIPKTTNKSPFNPGWQQAMVEVRALQSSGTWELCSSLIIIKVGPNGQRLYIDFWLDYGDTFSLVAKMAPMRLFLSVAAICHWPLYQFDIKNAFLYGDHSKEVSIEQSTWFITQGKFGISMSSSQIYSLNNLLGMPQGAFAWLCMLTILSLQAMITMALSK